MKKLLIFYLITAFSMPVMAYTSSNFLISQLAYKNHDYETSLFDFNIDTAKYPNNDLLDKLIASVILENLEFANNISDNILKSVEIKNLDLQCLFVFEERVRMLRFLHLLEFYFQEVSN